MTVRIQDRNGVKVRVHEHPNGTWVDATCQCFGSPGRLHSTDQCPLLKAQQASSRRSPSGSGGES